MPNPVLRGVLTTSVLVATLLLVGLGAGVAAADPAEPDPGTVSEPAVGGDTPVVNEPQPTTPTTSTVDTPTIFDIPNALLGQLRDFLGRPLSIFGNGRVPGTHTSTDTGKPKNRGIPTTDKPEPTNDPPTVPESVVQASTNSSDDVGLPSTPPDPIPVPDVPVRGHERVRWTLNLSDPNWALTSLGDTLNTVNSLLTDCFAPYNPFQPPAPAPAPAPATTFRTFDEEPAVDAGGTGVATPLSTGSSELTILQAPILVPQVRFGVPAPVPAQVPGAATAGTGGPSPGVSAPVGSAPVGSAPSQPLAANGSSPVVTNPVLTNPVLTNPALTNSALINPMSSAPPLREGYSQYLRSARPNEIAGVAIPGLAGLIAITFGGGVVGYRQANCGRYLRSEAARFLA